jgi:RNA polymerase sigma-70 factor, ECF subfamily
MDQPTGRPVHDDTIQRARRGDRQAQANLLTQLQDVWYRFSLSLLRREDLAREAVQETALRFLQGLAQFRQQSSLKTWSLGIALNVARELRRTARAPRQSVEQAQAMLAARWAASASSPERAAEAAEDRRALEAVLAELPPRQREVVLLRFFEGLSVAETAAASGMAEGTVKAALHQAFRALRKKWRLMTHE